MTLIQTSIPAGFVEAEDALVDADGRLIGVIEVPLASSLGSGSATAINIARNLGTSMMTTPSPSLHQEVCNEPSPTAVVRR